MPPTLTVQEIAGGVLSLIDKRGSEAITARALASELHVAPATLYTVVPSLSAADDAARNLLVAEIAPRLPSENVNTVPLFEWAQQFPNRARYLIDPTRSDATELSSLFVDTATTLADTDSRAVAATVLALGPQAEPSELDRIFRSMWTVVAETAGVESTPSQPIDAEAIETAIDQVIDQLSLPERHQRVRRVGASIAREEGLDGWSFRRLVEETGVALTSLHRIGERRAHLFRAYTDVSNAIALVAHERTNDPAAFLGLVTSTIVATGLPSLMHELRRPRSDDEVLGDLFDPVAARVSGFESPDLGLSVLSALLVGRWAARDTDPARWSSAAGFTTAVLDAFRAL